jgi:hypothetical protein
MSNHGSVSECMNQIEVALKKHDTYRSNYDVLMQLPIVMKLQNKNEKLKKQVAEYKEIIDELTAKLDGIRSKQIRDSFISGAPSHGLNHSSHVKIVESKPETETKKLDVERIAEQLPTVDVEQPDIVTYEDSVTQQTPNIVYEIVDDDAEDEVDPQPSKDEVVEEEEEEEEEVVEPVSEEKKETEKPVTTEDEAVEEEEEEVEEAVTEENKDAENPVTEEEDVEEEEEEEETTAEEGEEGEEGEDEVEEEEKPTVSSQEEIEEEVYEVTINGKTYYTTNEVNGVIYSVTSDGEIGDEVGEYKDGKPTFNG